MLKKLAFAVLVLSLAGGVARAQEAEDEEIRPRPVRSIRAMALRFAGTSPSSDCSPAIATVSM